ncbi:MAG: hypothetical protein QM813_04240 [Verrucomicrobiota bacterium]
MASNSFGMVFGADLTFVTVVPNPDVVQEVDPADRLIFPIRTNGVLVASASSAPSRPWCATA